MKVIFLKNQGSNKRGEIKEIAEGYARNFLIPQGIVALATKENIKVISQEKEKKLTIVRNNFNQAKSLADKLAGKKIEMIGKANEAGKLYSAISEKEIKERLKVLGFNIANAKLIIEKPLKEIGDYEVLVDFGQKIMAKIIVVVKI